MLDVGQAECDAGGRVWVGKNNAVCPEVIYRDGEIVAKFSKYYRAECQETVNVLNDISDEDTDLDFDNRMFQDDIF